MTYIEAKNLDYYYPRETKKTLDNINFTIDKGDFILITGKSGSGKSTLARCISGTVPYFYGGTIGGEILINGKDMKTMSHNERAKEITMVFQDPERQLMMNKVHREVAFGLENVGMEESKIKRRVWESMQFSNLLSLAYRDINSLSGGEKQKVAITSALSYMPECIILDEPTSQLDPSSAEEVVSLIRKINEELSVTVIVIEQRIEKWFEEADKIMVMENGSLMFYGDKKSLYKDEKVYNFLPLYLKLSKILNIKDMPQSSKLLRKQIDKYEFNSPERVEHNENKIAIQIQNLTCFYDDVEAVKNLNLEVREGEFLGILGANGAGKSTLLKAMMGLIKYKGSIKVFNKEVSKTKIRDLAGLVGYVSQNPNDYITKDTVYEEIKFTLDNYNIKDYFLIDETLKSLAIYDLKDKNPRDLSGGQKQRVAIASILVLKPKILMLDEPTRGLDIEIKNKLGETLKLLNKSGTTVILVTHDMDFAGEFCDNFVLMFDGEKISEGSASDILSDGIFYTTTINKLLRNANKDIFTLNQAQKLLKKSEAKL